METPTLEIAAITLKEGCTEADLVTASDAFQKGFLDSQPGFLSRELLRKGPGQYIDLVRWASEAASEAVMAKAETSELCHAYFGVMEFNPENPHSGVTHYQPVASYVPA